MFCVIGDPILSNFFFALDYLEYSPLQILKWINLSYSNCYKSSFSFGFLMDILQEFWCQLLFPTIRINLYIIAAKTDDCRIIRKAFKNYRKNSDWNSDWKRATGFLIFKEKIVKRKKFVRLFFLLQMAAEFSGNFSRISEK